MSVLIIILIVLTICAILPFALPVLLISMMLAVGLIAAAFAGTLLFVINVWEWFRGK